MLFLVCLGRLPQSQYEGGPFRPWLQPHPQPYYCPEHCMMQRLADCGPATGASGRWWSISSVRFNSSAYGMRSFCNDLSRRLAPGHDKGPRRVPCRRSPVRGRDLMILADRRSPVKGRDAEISAEMTNVKVLKSHVTGVSCDWVGSVGGVGKAGSHFRISSWMGRNSASVSLATV
jgi:hypothetical protein